MFYLILSNVFGLDVKLYMISITIIEMKRKENVDIQVPYEM
jgi:hypothetical protein